MTTPGERLFAAYLNQRGPGAFEGPYDERWDQTGLDSPYFIDRVWLGPSVDLREASWLSRAIPDSIAAAAALAWSTVSCA
jgi:hypothetical protein